MSETMLAIEIDHCKLHAITRKIPTPSNSEVLIEVHAAGVNRPDIMQKKGLYPAPPGASDIPGLEIAGTIIELGHQVTHLKKGMQVCALVTGGGYAEYCIAHSYHCLPLPNGYNFIQAAALPETFFTVYSNLFDRAKLKPNETLLVHGGSGGIGSTAIQLSKAMNITVFTTAGNDEKCNYCRNLGADATINYNKKDFVSEIMALTDEKGVNVILDIIGGDYFPRNIKCMAFDARLLQIALQKGSKSEINLLPIMLKRLLITGSTLRVRDNDFKRQIANQLLEKVWPLLESGRIKPVANTTLPLTEASEAHRIMENSEHLGKIVLTINRERQI